MNIGLFFGSFNPIHIGHMIIANHMVEHSDMDQIWFVVTPHNPHKKKSSLLDDNHRLNMANIAVEDYKNLKASNIEFGLPQPNYTVDTLAYISEKHPQHNFSLIMGEDNLKGFHKWKNNDVILENHTIYVYPRKTKGTVANILLKQNKIIKVDAPIVEISSTLIRNSIAEKKNFRPLVSHNVWEYIDEMNFYKK